MKTPLWTIIATVLVLCGCDFFQNKKQSIIPNACPESLHNRHGVLAPGQLAKIQARIKFYDEEKEKYEGLKDVEIAHVMRVEAWLLSERLSAKLFEKDLQGDTIIITKDDFSIEAVYLSDKEARTVATLKEPVMFQLCDDGPNGFYTGPFPWTTKEELEDDKEDNKIDGEEGTFEL
jgi:hypothetical protein